MCTVTLLPIEHADGIGVRIGCSRDESVLRPSALPPISKSFGKRSALLPVDPQSNGTWIAANDAGLALVLLNRNRTPANKTPTANRSRGEIIPSLLHCESIVDATEEMRLLGTDDFGPFRLLIVSREAFAEIDSTQQVDSYAPCRFDRPRIFTSSGLGDEVVEGPRTELFRCYFFKRKSSNCMASLQDRFHLHRWTGREHLSVCMSRKDARTVSYTVVQMLGQAVSMTYRAFDSRMHLEPITWLDRRPKSTELALS